MKKAPKDLKGNKTKNLNRKKTFENVIKREDERKVSFSLFYDITYGLTKENANSMIIE